MKSDFLLDPQIAYLNHGSFGACPKPVFEAYQRYQLELETEPVTFLQRRFPDLMNTARTSLSDFLGSHPDQVAFVRNATFGMNQAARSLDLKPGDKVLTSSQEYGAIDRMWQAVCADRGAELVRVPIALPCQSAEAIIAAFANHLNPAVRVISFSHITSESALVFPAAEIVELAKAAGAITVIDGAHAPGQIPLNLDDLGADMYIGNCHKWMMAPKGAAFFHASAEWAERARPLVVGWGDHSLGKTPLVVECDWQGTVDISAFLAVRDAIHYRDKNDWDNVSLKCRGVLDEYFPSIQQAVGSESIYGNPALRPPQMACFRLPADTDARLLHYQLFEDHKVDIPVFSNADGIFIRTSVQAYNTAEDLDRLIAALG